MCMLQKTMNIEFAIGLCCVLLSLCPLATTPVQAYVESGMSAFIRRRACSSTVPHQSPPFPFTTSSPTAPRVCGPSTNSMISPRSSNYERLEGGLGPSRVWMRNIAWKRIVLCLAITVGVLWFLRPSKESIWPKKTPGEPLLIPSLLLASGIDVLAVWRPPVQIDPDHNHPPSHPSVEQPEPEVDDSPPTPVTPVEPHVPRPTSHESDSDPSKTVFCTTPHNPSSPLVQYALMIDAGSTGSRIHVYKFHNCGPSPTYEYETFVQKQPGLSAYAGRPDDAAQSLDSLLGVAMRVVPESLRRCTPVAVKATAGLRLLGTSQSAEILDAVRNRLSNVFPFPLASQDPVVIMDGRDEGVYAWVTANYLMDTIRADSPKTAVPYAVLDLGGASTQIVFEPVFSSAAVPDAALQLQEGGHRYELNFGGKEHVLYQHSYLGFGLMRARKRVHRLVNFLASFRRNDTVTELANPCLARGTRRVIEIETLDSDSETKSVTMFGEDPISGFEVCRHVMDLVMAKDA